MKINESGLGFRLQVGGFPHCPLPPLKERISMHIARIFHKFHSIFIKHKKYELLLEPERWGVRWWKKKEDVANPAPEILSLRQTCN